MYTKHTGKMPWDDIWDFRYYRISRVKCVRYKIIKKEIIKKDINQYKGE